MMRNGGMSDADLRRVKSDTLRVASGEVCQAGPQKTPKPPLPLPEPGVSQ